MATEEELIAIRVRVREAAKAARELERVARGIDEVGDEARQTSRQADRAARSIRRLNRANSGMRVGLGPLSVGLRGATFAVGGLVIGAEKLTVATMSAGEAVTSLAGGGAAAGGVGLLALKQATGVAALGLGNLKDALGGSEEAARALSPQAYELFRQLTEGQATLRETAEAATMPGLAQGAQKAMRNFGVLNRIVRDTGVTLGGLAENAGGMLGSGEWGRDLARLGNTNAKIIDHLGDAGLHLADAARHILVEAGPLALWLARSAESGARAVEVWADGARKGGDLREFFRGAQTDMRLFGRSLEHVGSGVRNLFGSQDVDGTRFLRTIELATQRFETWTRSSAVRRDFGAAIREEVYDGVGAAASAVAASIPTAAARAAELFWQSFWGANAEGKALIGLFTGAKVAKIAGALRGSTPANPLWVRNVGGGGGGGRGGGKAGGGAAKIARKAARLAWPVALAAGTVDSFRQLDRNGQSPLAGPRSTGEQLMGPRRQPILDAQGFPVAPSRGPAGPANPRPLSPPRPFGPFVVENHMTLKVEGDVLARKVTRTNAKRRARKGG